MTSDRVRARKAPSMVVIAAYVFGAMTSTALSFAQDCPGTNQERWDSGDPNLWIGFVGTSTTVPLSGGNPGGYLEGEKT
jgi:hypothetical protein